MFYCSISKHHTSSTENNRSFLPQYHYLPNVLSQLSLAEAKLSDKISAAKQDFESQPIWTCLSTTPVNIFLTSILTKLNCLTSCSTKCSPILHIICHHYLSGVFDPNFYQKNGTYCHIHYIVPLFNSGDCTSVG